MIGNSSSAIRTEHLLEYLLLMLEKDRIADLHQKMLFNLQMKCKIYKKIKIQYGKKFKSSKLYGSSDAGKKFLQILKKLDKFSTQKLLLIN